MGKAERYLIPSRFAITTGHLLAVLVSRHHWEGNVAAGLGPNPSRDQQADATAVLQVAWTVAVCCFVMDFLGMFGGFSIFFRSVNLAQSMLHFLGALYTCWFVLQAWNFEVYWKICGLFSILPALIELGVLLSIFVFQQTPY